MRTYVRIACFCLFLLPPVTAVAQSDQHQHAGEASTALPQQCADMMPMMQQMMQMMQMMHGGMGQKESTMQMPMNPQAMSQAGKAYMEAMKNMEQPMMQAAQVTDPDMAFVRAMIPHHQGAIDMAKAVLQHGKDEQVKTWANQIIKAQEAEIAEMQEWLNNHPR